MSGKAMCIRQAHIDAGAARVAMRFALKEKTAAITSEWKEGFAALKAANDRAQEDVATWKQDEAMRIANELRTNLAACESEFNTK